MAKNSDYSLRIRQGTLKQLFTKGSAGPNDNGRILNALDFPLPTSDLSPDALSTDLHAWIATERLPFCNAHAAPLPSRDLRWGLVATYGALHYGHIDSDGFGTFLNVLVGAKYWFVARPKNNNNFRQTGYTYLYSLNNWCMEQPNLEMWCIEAILLTPGMQLYEFFSFEIYHSY